MDPNKLDCNVLTYYMNRIYSFLTSQKTSQVFPGLSKDVEDILVKVASQNDLKLQGYDDDFKALVSIIKSEIERKKGEYLLSCDFQEACGTRSLIYTKTLIPITFKQPQPLRKPNSMSSSNQPLPASSDLITQSFKLRCLNATLKFIKDETRLSLRYPEMASEQAQHVVNMFEHSNSDGDLGLGYKTLYAPLWEAMKIFGLKYKFTLKYTDPKDKNMKCLVLDKIPIVHATRNKENLDQNSFISLPDLSTENTEIKNNIKIEIDSNINTETLKKPIKTAKYNLTKLFQTIKLIGDDFLTGTYKKILDFVMDEASASMVFNNMSLQEAQILIHWQQIMKNNKYQMLLSGKCMFVLSQLSYNYKKMDFNIIVNEGKRSKQDFRRNITFTKVPVGECLPSIKKRVDNPFLSSRSSIELNSSQGSANQMSATTSSARSSSATRSSARSSLATTSSASLVSANTVSKKKEILSAKKSNPTSVIKPVANNGNSNKVDTRQKTGNTKENKIKMKLLEGLDQPVTSDKAMKMMLNMGWEGGALGTRGEGIMEPIRPSLDTGKRYGLGAPIEEPKPKTDNSKSKSRQYHAETLNLILNLLTSDLNTREITFPERFMKKEWNYLKNLIITFNKGLRVNVYKRGYDIAQKIADILSDSDWILTAGIKIDHLTIVIKKSILPLFPNELKLYCEIVALTESNIYRDGTFKDIYKGLRNRKPIRPPQNTVLNDLGNTTDIIKKESGAKDQKRSDPRDQNKDTMKPLNDVSLLKQNKSINEKDSNNQYEIQKETKITEDSKCNAVEISDDEVQIIEEDEVTIIIASSDESDLLKSDSEDDLSIKLNDDKKSKEKSAEDKSEKDNNNLGKDDIDSDEDDNNFAKENHFIKIIENMTIKVEKDLENTHISEGEHSKEYISKRSRPNSQNSFQDPKRLKRFCKKIAIIPENYPQTKMDDEKALEIQILLLDAINNNSELPLLKCYGIKNGTLIYSCHTEKTFHLMEKIVTKANSKISYEIVTEKCNKKMAFRISSYIEETTSNILNRLVKFNEGLNIDDWIVIKKEQHSDFVVIFVNIDNKSYSYLKDVNFSLYAGVDVALFTHVWD